LRERPPLWSPWVSQQRTKGGPQGDGAKRAAFGRVAQDRDGGRGGGPPPCRCRGPRSGTHRGRGGRPHGRRIRRALPRQTQRPQRIPGAAVGDAYFPSFLEPGRRAEQALLSVVQEAYVHGVSTRKVEEFTQALSMTGIRRSEVSRVCAELDEAGRAVPDAPHRGSPLNRGRPTPPHICLTHSHLGRWWKEARQTC